MPQLFSDVNTTTFLCNILSMYQIYLLNVYLCLIAILHWLSVTYSYDLQSKHLWKRLSERPGNRIRHNVGPLEKYSSIGHRLTHLTNGYLLTATAHRPPEANVEGSAFIQQFSPTDSVIHERYNAVWPFGWLPQPSTYRPTENHIQQTAAASLLQIWLIVKEIFTLSRSYMYFIRSESCVLQ